MPTAALKHPLDVPSPFNTPLPWESLRRNPRTRPLSRATITFNPLQIGPYTSIPHTNDTLANTVPRWQVYQYA